MFGVLLEAAMDPPWPLDGLPGATCTRRERLIRPCLGMEFRASSIPRFYPPLSLLDVHEQLPGVCCFYDSADPLSGEMIYTRLFREPHQTQLH